MKRIRNFIYKYSRYDNVLAIIKSAEVFHQLNSVRFNFSIRYKGSKVRNEVTNVKKERNCQKYKEVVRGIVDGICRKPGT